MISVLIVDDSAVARQHISILESDPEVRVIGTANDGEGAVEFLKEHTPTSSPWT